MSNRRILRANIGIYLNKTETKQFRNLKINIFIQELKENLEKKDE